MYAVPTVATVASVTNALAPVPEVAALGIVVPAAEYVVVFNIGALNTPDELNVALRSVVPPPATPKVIVDLGNDSDNTAPDSHAQEIIAEP